MAMLPLRIADKVEHHGWPNYCWTVQVFAADASLFCVVQGINEHDVLGKAQMIIDGLTTVSKAYDAVEPVLHWYQSDEHPERPLVDILADMAEDLQNDRKAALKLHSLVKAHTAGGGLGQLMRDEAKE